MPLTQTGRDLITKLLRGAAVSSEMFSSGFTYLHVGDSQQAFGSSQNQAGTSGASWFCKGMDAGFPTSTATNVITWQMTATTSEANFHWYEWLVRNASSSGTSGTALNRKQEDLGTKADTQSWAFSGQVTITT